ncbi:helix-turn-helix transcriptional regulator [Clavibacter tessellarius]|uniref:HTH cro/C1-type domain-containing protein n=1 Tax=Clavibacter tessellarius TaxID=31965 RepID=A0A225CJQ0_9MICO|nr:hypothetical protein B5P24_06235 [Clavibacter michiganensis subsp. tessellarius]UKF34383.1 helix-turn-helix transcriptional regulator [Clavibacter michiganensis subsp. tessellarius]
MSPAYHDFEPETTRDSPTDEFDTGTETDSERLARLLAEADIDLIDTLRRVREHRSLSQEQLGALMGVSQATVSSFESGASEPKLATIRRYAHALNVIVEHSVRPLDASLSSLFTWTTVSGFITNPRSTSNRVGTYSAANSKKSDFALAG